MINTITRGGQVSIPFVIRQELGLEDGSLLQFEIEGNRIIVTPVQVVPVKRSKKLGD